MAGAEIGGDTSVEWTIKADHVRKRALPKSAKSGKGGWRQHGVDETNFGAQFGFVITLKMPKAPRDRKTFITTLCRACADAQEKQSKAGAQVQITLPIEPKSPDQIRIKWKAKSVRTSTPSP
jgi:hypothetical protein